jgi:hypothetical protein
MSRSLVAALAVLSVMAAAEVALADGYVKIYDPGLAYRENWSGGEFAVVHQAYKGGYVGEYDSAPVDNHSSNTSFASFCLEANEYLNFETEYYGVLTTRAVQGGSAPGSTYLYALDGTPFVMGTHLLSADPISNETKDLYYLFRTGRLYGFDYTVADAVNDRPADSKALQQAIWAYEGESGGSTSSEFYSYASSNISLTDAQRNQVMVLSLWSGKPDEKWGSITLDDGTVLTHWFDVSNLTWRQDQLTLVPLPAAVLAGFGLLGGVGIVRQIRRKRNRLL